MAPLPPSNTARYRVDYSVGTHQHSMQFRSLNSPSALGGVVNAFLNALAGFIYQITIDAVEFAPAGSDIFNPVTTGIEGNTYGVGTPIVTEVPWAYTFIGRTTGGRRVRLAVFGAKNLGINYRFQAGESPELDAGLAVLVAVTGQLLGIDGLVPVWKTYINAQVNDHWLQEVRA